MTPAGDCWMQGEMIQAKFGSLAVAARQMEVFSTAVLLATLSPPKPPRKPEWRALMEQLSTASCAAYREVCCAINAALHDAKAAGRCVVAFHTTLTRTCTRLPTQVLP